MHSYLKDLQAAFELNKDDAYGSSMKKYMKGLFDYYGIPSPKRRQISKEFLVMNGNPPEDQLESIVKDCWDQPQREFQYFGMEMLGKVAKKAEICRVDLYEYLVVSKSWWDTIDYIASNLVGVHFRKFPDTKIPYTAKWMDSGNIWLQRTSLLFQLKYKKDTDLELIEKYIARLYGSKEFFINKAIGWILREYSKTDADWVRTFVNKNKEKLAPLSNREALKWLNRTV